MSAHDLQPGTMVGEYRVERQIGEGSFGTVYAAVHPVIGKRAAVKVLSFEHAGKQQQVSRFIEEARNVNRIGHRGIVDIFSFDQLPDGRHYFVMELLEGATLKEHLEKHRRIPLTQALPILRKVARALDAAHAKGIAHRDLKPDNLFLTFDEDGVIHPKLLDFGIAKLMGDTPLGGHKTATGTPMGTPLYMSPEQCMGQTVDHRTDIYAFGVLVHETLTGKLPFDEPNVMEVLMAHMSKEPPPMSSHAPDLPQALDAPVLRMLAKAPDERWPSVGQAVDALFAAAATVGVAVPSSYEQSGPQERAVHDSDGARHASALAGSLPVAPTVPAQPAQVATQPSAGHSGWGANLPAPVHQAANVPFPHAAYPQITGAHPLPQRRSGGSVLLWIFGGGCLLSLFALLLIILGVALVADKDPSDNADRPTKKDDSIQLETD